MKPIYHMRSNMKRIVYLIVCLLFIVLGCSRRPHVVLKTNMGAITIVLNDEVAPKHTENFIKLVNQGFLVGTKFHRVIPGSLIQGGDPNSKDTDRLNDGLGGPGYTVDAEINLPHKKGSVGAARKSDPVNPKRKSNGSQFYICLNDIPQLDQGGYTIFGKVVNGMDVAERIAQVKRDARDNPVRPVIIEQVYLD
jgi:cyclophilin family peptidyl-prolyl cis-trans isomerase